MTNIICKFVWFQNGSMCAHHLANWCILSEQSNLIDGIKTELKTISNITSKDLSGRIAKKIRSAGSQSGNIIIDLSKQKGATADVAETALNRAFGSSDKIKADSIAGPLTNMSKAVFAAEEGPSIEEGPHPVPPEKAPVQVLLS